MASRNNTSSPFIKLTRLVGELPDIDTLSIDLTEALFTELAKFANLSFTALFAVDKKKEAVTFKSLKTAKNINRVSKQKFDEILTKLTKPHTVLNQLVREKELAILSHAQNEVKIHLWDGETAPESTDDTFLLHVFDGGEYFGVILFGLQKNLKSPKETLPIFESYSALAEMFIRNFFLQAENKGASVKVASKSEDLEREKEEFLSMVAHELRAPTAAMKGFLSMVIQGDTGDIPEKARGFLVDVANENDRLIRLVNNMLNVSRIEEERMSYQYETESLARVSRTVFSQFLPEAKRKGLEFTLQLPPDLKDRVLVDPDRIYEAISNLVSNAVKYTITGYVILKLSNPREKWIRVEVVDTGPGISKEEQAKLFTKFHRAESNVGKTTGTGLGLYISKLLVEKFDGKIGLVSKLGKGCTFWFELPLAS